MSANLNPADCKVAVVSGGLSNEREISLKSGQGVKEALVGAGYPVTDIDPAKKEDLSALIQGNFDVAFLCTHGKYGEDGAIQGLLELIGLPYTGPGVLGSAIAMNKGTSKTFYELAGINTPAMVWLKKGDKVDIDEIVSKVGEHCVVKAAGSGSTIGLYIATSADQIEGFIADAFKVDDDVIVEKFVEGDEFTVAVMGNETARALPVIQIIPKNDFYDFESKYAPGGSQHLCPAPISEELTAQLKDMAEKSHIALGCRGASRTDILVDKEGVCWVLETNTLPGMTPTSLLPDAAAAEGTSYAELCEELIRLALQ